MIYFKQFFICVQYTSNENESKPPGNTWTDFQMAKKILHKPLSFGSADYVYEGMLNYKIEID